MAVRISINYNDLRWKRFDLTRYVRALVSKVVQIHKTELTDFSLSVLACSDWKIRELNRQYRKKNKVTNVLAWPAIHCFLKFDQNYLSYSSNKFLFLGDIAISYDSCLREASAKNIQLDKHCCKLLAHAILHLMGYDHDISVKTKRMESMETRILNSVLTNRPKICNF